MCEINGAKEGVQVFYSNKREKQDINGQAYLYFKTLSFVKIK